MTHRALDTLGPSLGVALCAIVALPASGEELVALSLSEANRQLASGAPTTAALELGGVSRFVGLVWDGHSGDAILLGRALPGLPPAHIDDLVVAIRGQVNHGTFPLVSIDLNADAPLESAQTVRLEGGIEDTQFGSDFLAADVTLKKYSLGLLAPIVGAPGYIDVYSEEEGAGKDAARISWLPFDPGDSPARYVGERVSAVEGAHSRFWYKVMEDRSYVVESNGVFVIQELVVGVESATTALAPDGPPRRAGQRFASGLSSQFAAASREHPDLARLKTLFDIVAIANSLVQIPEAEDKLAFLFGGHTPQAVPTPRTFPLLRRIGTRGGGDRVVVSGGMRLEVLLVALEDGEADALRELVLLSRPASDALLWKVPIGDWQIPNAPELGMTSLGSSSLPGQVVGASIATTRIVLDPSGVRTFDLQSAVPRMREPTAVPQDVNLPRRTRMGRDSLTQPEEVPGGVTLPTDVSAGSTIDADRLFRDE